MKKMKKIAKRLRARARVLRQGGQHSTNAPLVADTLEEVANQLWLSPKKALKALVKARKAAKKAAKLAPTSPASNGATRDEPIAASARVAVRG